jgi:hypothetical protein
MGWWFFKTEKAMKDARKVALAASAFACAALFSFGWTEQGGISLSVESAQARVGRPLTPVSVAGVARRHNRRAGYYAAGAIGAGAVVAGTAGAVAAATAPNYYGWGNNAGGYNNNWGNNNWSGAHAAQTDPYFGQAHYVHRAYRGISPYYGHSGWGDYKGRNSIACDPGSLTKLSDGQMYYCQ